LRWSLACISINAAAMIRVFLMLFACLLLSGCIPFVPIVQQQPAPLMPLEGEPLPHAVEMTPEQPA
jgi:hypothetical protein